MFFIMKAKLLLIGAFIIALFTFAACSDDNELTYSCNPQADTWVKKNLTKVRSMNRSDWKKINQEYNLAAYRAFTPNQKLAFWKDKFNEVSQMQWTAKEKLHIAKALAFIVSHKEFFSDEALNDEQLNELELFFHKWKEEAINQLGWSKELCFAIAGNGGTLINKKGEIATQITTEPTNPSFGYVGNLKKRDCNCNTGHLSDFCITDGPCDKADCNVSEDGCGWVLVMKCNGRCSRFEL